MVTKIGNRVQKAKKELTLIDWPIDSEGNYIIRTKADAAKLVEMGGNLSVEIDRIKVDLLRQREANYEHIRKALKKYQDEHDIAEIRTKNFRSDLVERTGKLWVWQDSDIPEGAKDTVSLLTIIRKKFKSKMRRAEVIEAVTTTRLDPQKLDDAIKQGILTRDDVDPAYVEYVSTSYVQIKENK